MYDAVTDGALHKTDYVNGQVEDESLVCHHFEVEFFCIFGFLDDFALPTACPGGSATRRVNFEDNLSNRVSNHKWYTYQSGLLVLCS